VSQSECACADGGFLFGVFQKEHHHTIGIIRGQFRLCSSPIQPDWRNRLGTLTPRAAHIVLDLSDIHDGSMWR
jgi:hypothetical protein